MKNKNFKRFVYDNLHLRSGMDCLWQVGNWQFCNTVRNHIITDYKKDILFLHNSIKLIVNKLVKVKINFVVKF